MSVLVQRVTGLVKVFARMYARKWYFLAVFLLVFALNVSMLARLDLLPNAPIVAPVSITLAETATPAPAVAELPVKIEIPSINLTASVANPDTTNIQALDNLLLSGAVRYPTSAELGENGNVVLFGHSSYLPIVGNPAYKTFDGIQKLHAGDTVTMYSYRTAYIYAVKSVAKENANDAAIPLSIAGKELTLSTCDSFGAKTDRFVVVADLVESHVIPL